MVVGDAGGEADSATDQEVTHDGLEPGLSALEVRAGDQGALLTGILNDCRVECVLGRAIQIEYLLFDARNAVKNGRGERLVSLNASLQVIKGVNLRQEEHLSVGGPQNDDFASAGFLVTNVASDGIDKFAVRSCHHVIGAISLV